VEKNTVFWFRRDLRLSDNKGLFKALSGSNKVLPIFIFDKNILHKLPPQDARVELIFHTLQKLNDELEKHESSIQILHGEPLAVFNDLCSKYAISKVVTNRDYEPYALERDHTISDFLKTKGISFETHKDQVIFERNEVVKADGKPYTVYTPYSKKWLYHFDNTQLETYPSENYLHQLVKNTERNSLSLEKLGFQKSDLTIFPLNFNTQTIEEYEATRNFPALESTSRLGSALRFGQVSIRKVVAEATACDNNTFLKELIWREFFMQILWHFPQTVEKCFKTKYEHIQWRNKPEDFEKWCLGKTGYPMVDAGMRELNTTGFMHNRVRMVVGSFLCKHLLIDWRWGAAYFAEKLLDYEEASNIGNWQWVAGCGVDAAPYFRIFNPTEQLKKFDSKGVYTTKWVPEYQTLEYPPPMVDHKMARERCLRVYKDAVA